MGFGELAVRTAVRALDEGSAVRYDRSMIQEDWLATFEKEILQAEAARAAGNEGKARVCARRAAGLLAYQVLLRDGIEPQGNSALEYLQQMKNHPGLDEKTRDTAALFLLRVDNNKNLPVDVDLLTQARWLRRHLFGG